MSKWAQIVLAAGAIIITVIAGLGAWVLVSSLPAFDVPPESAETVAAKVYQATDPALGEDVDALHRRLIDVAARPDTWVLVSESPAIELYRMGYYRQEYLFNDSSVLVVYSGESENGRRRFDGVLIDFHEPLYGD